MKKIEVNKLTQEKLVSGAKESLGEDVNVTISIRPKIAKTPDNKKIKIHLMKINKINHPAFPAFLFFRIPIK